MTNLLELADILYGYPFPSSDFRDGISPEGLPIIRIRDVVPGRSNTIFVGSYDEKYLINNGDILVGMDGEFNLARWQGGPSLLNQRVCKITPRSDMIDERYLLWALQPKLKAIEAVTPFVTVKHLSAKALAAINFEIPPLTEQRRIAAVLENADAIRRKRQVAVALTEQLLRSTFLEIFGAPSERWEMATVENLAESRPGSIRTGPFGSQLLHSEFTDSGIAVLGIDNAVENEFRWGRPRFISEKKYEDLRRYTVAPRDIIITIMGTCGRCAIIPDDIPTAINTKHLCCITLDKSKCVPEFLHSYFLFHPTARIYLRKYVKGAIMDGLNMGIISQLPVPIAPMELQRRYQRFTVILASLKRRLSTAALESENLFNSLVQRAFTGQL